MCVGYFPYDQVWEENLVTVEDPSDPLLAALGYDPVTLDARSGQPPEAAAARLLALELAGHAERLPGNLFRRLG